jgi:hypothetical protein
MRVKVKAPKGYYYDRRQYDVGDELDMPDTIEAQVNFLCAVDVLEKVEAAPQYQTRAMKAEPAPAAKVAAPEPAAEPEASSADGRKRFYRRRDVEAEK